MNSLARDAWKTVVGILAFAVALGGAVGWVAGELISRHDPRRKYP